MVDISDYKPYLLHRNLFVWCEMKKDALGSHIWIFSSATVLNSPVKVFLIATFYCSFSI